MPLKKPDRYLYFERGADKYLGSFLIWLISRIRSGSSPGPVRNISSIDRILLIKLHGIGNIIMLLPSIRLLKKTCPDARIDILTFESNREIAENIDEISDVITLGRRNFRAVITSILRSISLLRSACYQVVIDFEQFAYISSFMAFASNAPIRVGFLNPTHIRHLLFTDPVAYRETDHMSRIFLRLVTAVTGPGDPPLDRSLHIKELHQEEARAFLKRSGMKAGTPLVLIHPGSSPNFTSRQWPLERFAALADRITMEGGFHVIVTGSVSESELAEKMLRMMEHPGTSAAGKLSVMGLAALCRKAAFVVSNDTLLVHLASAMGTPVVGIYGPNTPFLYGPGPDDHHTVLYKKLPCSPCLANVNRKVSDCRAPRCMDEISVGEVYEKVRVNYFFPPLKIVEVRGENLKPSALAIQQKQADLLQ